MAMGDEYKFKIVLVGDECVGKTSLLTRYIENQFIEYYSPTIGVDFKTKRIPLMGSNFTSNLQIWDTAGKKEFEHLTTSYYYNSKAFILVFSLTSLHSFENVKRRMDMIKKYNSDPNVTIYLCGTKSDLINKREVTQDNIDIFTKDVAIPYFEVSSQSYKDKDKIKDMFEALAQELANEEIAQKQIKELLNMNIVSEYESYLDPFSKKGKKKGGQCLIS